MKIDGNEIASAIKKNISLQSRKLKRKKVSPQLAVILIGNDPSSIVYVGRKRKFGQETGVKVSIFHHQTISPDKLFGLISDLNKDESVHGIIIQRPVAGPIDPNQLNLAVSVSKDVDGFHPDSLYNAPIAEAVYKILTAIYINNFKRNFRSINLWLEKKKILVIGRGETAGKPIAEFLTKKKIKFKVAHSQTDNLKGLCLASGIILSCVGKPNIVRHDMVLPKTILIGVGLHPENERLAPDYNQDEISNIVTFYTPVPGGVGPVNVACLFENLMKAVNKQNL